MDHETFWSLLRDPAHWEFEIFLVVLIDGVLGAFLLPLFRRWISHHKSDDNQLATLQQQMQEVRARLGLKD
jgi:hypothetical protein